MRSSQQLHQLSLITWDGRGVVDSLTIDPQILKIGGTVDNKLHCHWAFIDYHLVSLTFNFA